MKNSIVAILYYVVYLVLNFISRRIFLEYLGAEILGLNTTATNLLQFLNLAELGIGFAVAFTLYKPLARKDYESINEIISLQGGLYKRIAFFILSGAVVLSLFFPLIFHKSSLPLWYAYASFGVLLYSALLTYFANYKQILLTANQEEYKITLSYRVCRLSKTLIQIILISTLENGYVWWLITEVIFSTIASIILQVIVRKNHPYLNNSKHKFSVLRRKYPEIEKKIKQLFFHRVAAFAVNQTSPLIIYGFLSLKMVAYYGNYTLIISGCGDLLTSFFNGVGASVGNLISEGNKKNIIKVFEELFCLRFTITVVACICVFVLATDFIVIWIGKQYVLSKVTLSLMIVSMYFSLSRGVVDTFLNGYGLYKDIWAPIVEAVVNVGCSILGGYLWGLNGIILGVIISQILILFLWKPYFLFTQGIGEKVMTYVKIYSRCIAALFIGLPIIYLCYIYKPLGSSTSLAMFFGNAAYLALSSFVILAIFMYIFTDGTKQLFRRFIPNVKH